MSNGMSNRYIVYAVTDVLPVSVIFVCHVPSLCLKAGAYDTSGLILEKVYLISFILLVVTNLKSCFHDVQYPCMAQRIRMAAHHAVAGSACNHLLSAS